MKTSIGSGWRIIAAASLSRRCGFALRSLDCVPAALMGFDEVRNPGGDFSAEERTVEEWINTALEIPNPWTDLLAEKAKDRNLYICANILEKDPAWPGR
ncbi:MAG: hypothetical protein V3S44_06880, partial [Alphaproteobacteria bacterium]